ncbi:MAG: hypothetical protein MJ252_02995, partial [archaeon]|nr:hypothetical protein [archaeon]
MDDLLKCDYCGNKFNSDLRIPLVIKCGHTFCKNCLINKKNLKKDSSCPLCKISNLFIYETSIRNRKLEDIIKFYFNLSSSKINSNNPKENINCKKIFIKPIAKNNQNKKNKKKSIQLILNTSANFESRNKNQRESIIDEVNRQTISNFEKKENFLYDYLFEEKSKQFNKESFNFRTLKYDDSIVEFSKFFNEDNKIIKTEGNTPKKYFLDEDLFKTKSYSNKNNL